MDKKDQIIAAIIEAIKEVNQTLPADRKINTQLDDTLYGQDGNIDSLTVTLLIVAIEQKIEESMGIVVTLIDYSVGLSPLKSIASLCEYISKLIDQKK